MPKPNIKIYIVISLVIILVTLFLLSIVLSKRKEQQISPTPSITPITDQFSNSNITPEVIQPTGFTGVLEEELPTEIKNESEQVQELSNRVPISEAQFDIDFDWGEYKFIVKLKEPKDQAQTTFDQWLQQNYPNIPIEEFIIN